MRRLFLCLETPHYTHSQDVSKSTAIKTSHSVMFKKMGKVLLLASDVLKTQQLTVYEVKVLTNSVWLAVPH